jgi:hypothetical protein
VTILVYHALSSLLKRLGRTDVTPPNGGGLGRGPLGSMPLGGSS